MQAGGPGWLGRLLPGGGGEGGGVGMVRTGEANEEGLWGPVRGELNPSCTLTRGGFELEIVIYLRQLLVLPEPQFFSPVQWG